jgi:hypothetical protein
MQGRLMFKNMILMILQKKTKDITMLLSNQNKKLANEKFHASFSDEPIEKY